jgi:hypothetical protein
MTSLPFTEDVPEALLSAWHQEEADAIRAEAEAVFLETRQASKPTNEAAGWADNWITVPQLADGIRRTLGTTRNLLERGLIPGAERKTPGVKNSPWLIPASAIEAFKRKER